MMSKKQLRAQLVACQDEMERLSRSLTAAQKQHAQQQYAAQQQSRLALKGASGMERHSASQDKAAKSVTQLSDLLQATRQRQQRIKDQLAG